MAHEEPGSGAQEPSSEEDVDISSSESQNPDVSPLGALLAEATAVEIQKVVGNVPTTGTAKETGPKGGGRSPDDASPDYDAD
jgi:hypothetical protein